MGARPRPGVGRTSCGRVRRGTLLAVDYGHPATRVRPTGRSRLPRRAPVVPRPRRTCDLTAHVAMDTLDHDELGDQREALRALGVDATAPRPTLARTDPAGYLHALAARRPRRR